MRAALILPTQFPNGPKLTKQGVDTVLKPATDVDQAKMDELRKFFPRVGLFIVPTWYVSLSKFLAMSETEKVAWAKKFAGICSDEITRTSSPSFFRDGKTPVPCILNVDNEYPSSKFMEEFHREFRRLRTSRFLIWSLQGMQGGWMEPTLVQRINADSNMLVAPFHYYDNMDIRLDGSVAAINLVKQGIRWERITGYKGLRQGIEAWWDGILYLENWEQLPA